MPCLGKGVGGGGVGGRLSKSPKTEKWAQVHYLYFTGAMEIYCICMFYLNEQTDYPILIGITQGVHL